MKSWNTHAWYVTGILLALLIGSFSVEWSNVQRLPEIIAFAVGLSSLILAIIAIVQSLAGGAEVTRALGDLGVAARDLRSGTDELKQLAGDVSGVGSKMVQSHDELIQLLNRQTQPAGTQASAAPATSSGALDLSLLPLGGAEAFYAAAWGQETGKTFFMGLFRADDEDWVNVAFDDGFLSALIRTGVIDGTYDGNQAKIRSVRMSPADARQTIRLFKYGDELRERFEARLDRIDTFFRSGIAS